MIGRISRRAMLIIVAMLVFATPAMASLVVHNFMEADITSADACFVKVAGDDFASYTGAGANDPLSSFSNDETTDLIQINGADLLEEKITVRGMRGDRVMYTDVVRYQNNCDISLDVRLVTDAATATGDWTDRSARIYLSALPATIGTDPAGLGRPGVTGDGWDVTPIVVEADTGAIPSGNQSTGTVTLAPGQELRGAFVISAGVNSSNGAVGTINWVAEASNAN